MSLSCILIGQDNLLIQCGSYLLEKGHHIKWVVTKVKSIQSWCESNAISWVESLDKLSSDKEGSVDYLFSIVNGTILKKEDLNIARFGSINYHDALLPQYAGVHATTWAIMNGETAHGITWHIINEGIDEGDVVYQSRFDLAPNETALTLNLRCFDEATKGFIELIEKIETGSLTRQKQAVEGRSYYGLTHVLPNFGYINWNTDDAAHIDASCRALNFGNYTNNVGTLKLFLGERYLIVREASVSTQSCEFNVGGTILAINQEGILISTQSTPILLKKLITAEGNELSSDDLVQFYNLRVHNRLPLIDDSYLESSSSLYRNALKSERFWLTQLSDPLEHTTFSERILDDQLEYTELEPIVVSDHLMSNAWLYPMSAVFIYLYRLNNYEDSTVFLDNSTESIPEIASLLSTLLPLTPKLQSDLTCHQVMELVGSNIEALYKHGAYLSDIFTRQPNLAKEAKSGLITLGMSQGDMSIPNNSLIHFAVDVDSNQLRVAHRVNTRYQGGVLKPLVDNISVHLSNILQAMYLNPDQLIHELVFLTEAEQKKLITWGVGEYIPLPSNSITELFEQHVRCTPQRIALHQRDKCYTYEELWLKAEQVLSFVQELHLAPLSDVAVCVESGIEMVALLLGILKAGLTCVVLDAKNPIGISDGSVIITRKEYRPYFDNSSLRSYEVDDLLPVHLQKNMRTEVSIINSKAGILVPSKEAEIRFDALTQKELINYCYWFVRTTDLTHDSVLDLSSSVDQGLSISCILAPLLVGGSLAFNETSPQDNPQIYLQYLAKYKVSHTRLTADDWSALLRYTNEHCQLDTLHQILLTSEVDKMDVSRWLILVPQSRFIIMSTGIQVC